MYIIYNIYFFFLLRSAPLRNHKEPYARPPKISVGLPRGRRVERKPQSKPHSLQSQMAVPWPGPRATQDLKSTVNPDQLLSVITGLRTTVRQGPLSRPCPVPTLKRDRPPKVEALSVGGSHSVGQGLGRTLFQPGSLDGPSLTKKHARTSRCLGPVPPRTSEPLQTLTFHKHLATALLPSHG